MIKQQFLLLLSKQEFLIKYKFMIGISGFGTWTLEYTYYDG
jgi:hypothetical protein